MPSDTLQMKRRTSAVFLTLLVLAGCGSTEFKPLVFAPDVNLQDPLPGMAIVYLLRIPYDGATITVFFDSRKMAMMRPESYTAVSVLPGTYNVRALASDTQSEAVPSVLTVSAGERRFLYASAPTRSSVSIAFVPIGGAGVIPLFTPTNVAAGLRTWKECSELDAQGLMSNSKPVLPEPGAI
jgi:hypothetical protein